jgi:hypothetical protein
MTTVRAINCKAVCMRQTKPQIQIEILSQFGNIDQNMRVLWDRPVQRVGRDRPVDRGTIEYE